MPREGTVPTPPMSPAARAIAYGIFAWVSLALFLTTVGYTALDAALPQWLVVVGAVLPAAGAALGFLAKANTPTDDGGEGGGDNVFRLPPLEDGGFTGDDSQDH